MKETIKALLVEDDLDDAEMVVRALRREGFDIAWHRVDTEASYLASLNPSLDVILSDFQMPQFDGLRALDLLKQSRLDIPFLLISGTIGEDTAVEAMRRGATDYLLKDRLVRLPSAIRQALEKNNLRKERHRALDALRENEERLKLALSSTQMGVWEWDLRTNAVFWSPECCEIAGLKTFGGTLDDCAKLLHPEDAPRVTAQWRQALDSGSAYLAEFRIVRPGGEVRSLSNHGRATFDETGRPLRMIGTMQDITEQRQLEEQFRQAQKMEVIGQLAGGLAHDFNNILTVIQGYTTLLDGNLIEISEATREISVAVDRATSLSRQLLTFSRKQLMQPRDLDLNAVVVDMTKMLRRTLGEDVTLVLESASDLPFIHADQGMMEQIILNLAVNARDAMPDGGRLSISTGIAALGDNSADENPNPSLGAGVYLRVSDQGCGIPPEIIPRIFEPFFTTKEIDKGTGLGLATVQGIVKQHRGTIRVTTEIGKGTAFEIVFPSIKAGTPSVETKPAEPQSSSGHETILLVDDEPTLRKVVRRALTHFGYNVLEAGSGKQALAVFEESQTRIDLLLTDVVMPDGMSGKDLAVQLNLKCPGLRVLYTSGFKVEQVSRGMDAQQQIHFLQKPFTMRNLAIAIRNCLSA